MQDCKIYFLDLWITITGDHLSTSTFQKPVDLYLYRWLFLAQPTSILYGLIYDTLHRYYLICIIQILQILASSQNHSSTGLRTTELTKLTNYAHCSSRSRQRKKMNPLWCQIPAPVPRTHLKKQQRPSIHKSSPISSPVSRLFWNSECTRVNKRHVNLLKYSWGDPYIFTFLFMPLILFCMTYLTTNQPVTSLLLHIHILYKEDSVEDLIF